MPILKGLSARHGKDTALQGWAFREMVFLLGVKDRPSLEHFEPQPHRFKQLSERLSSPSLYDDILAALARDGKPIPPKYLAPDCAAPYVPSKEIEGSGPKYTGQTIRPITGVLSQSCSPISPSNSPTGNTCI